MPDTIRDGTGDGYLAKVNANQRLYVSAVVLDENLAATKDGRSYNINTGEITLTDDNETPVSAIAVGLGPTTGGTGGIPVITVVRNPTAGTITSGSDVDINSNRNYGSSNTLTATAKKGATGLTMTGGVDHLLFYQGTSGRLFATIDELLPGGSSIGVKITPQGSNTSMSVYCAIICHVEDVND
jgi:hypothetical protein